jgi:hypothetical protein
MPMVVLVHKSSKRRRARSIAYQEAAQRYRQGRGKGAVGKERRRRVIWLGYANHIKTRSDTSFVLMENFADGNTLKKQSVRLVCNTPLGRTRGT